MGEQETPEIWSADRAASQLDEIDKKIIAALQVDGRMSFSELAPMVNLSDAATRQRVNRLIDRRVISIVAVTDALALGFGFQAMLGVGVTGDPTEITSALEKIPEIRYLVITAGRYDILVEVVCVDAEHLLHLSTQIRSLPGVGTVETLTYLRLVKQNYAWGVR